MNLKKLTWKKVGKGLGKVVDNKWTKLATAAALTATGAGAPAAAAILGGMSAGGKLAQGKRLTTALKGGAKDAALSYAGAKFAPKLGGLFKGGGMPTGAMQDAADDATQFAMPVAEPSRFRSIVSNAGKFLGGSDGFGADDLLKYGKAAGDAYGAYDTMQRRNRYEDIAGEQFAANAPLRDQARRMLMDDSRPDLSSVFSETPARYRRVRVGSVA